LVNKRQFDKAEALFLKAYLYDPADPFTLNNLGYVAEIQGQLDRAQKFYELASEQGCNAIIDRSNVKALKGKPMTAAIDGLEDSPMRVNHLNLAADPQNPFTLNNLGVASEAVGDYQAALKDYDEVASQHSTEAVIVTNDRGWGGKRISDMAAASAKRLEKLIADRNPDYSEAAWFNRRGVAAMNQNDWVAAKKAFLQAYSADSSSAFSLNNRGYVAEMDGDLETAQFFYEKAAKAMDANARVGLATQRGAEGRQLFSVVEDSDGKVNGALEKYSEQRHQQTAPIELTPRGGATVDDNAPVQEQPSSPAVPQTPN
jgi:tetratricopeptide (TPR) repeat protein